ncbi:MAG: hypothetical protein KDA05_02990, partial [Phycisphaerales bacterium]|nr:hypothetical protein [Phycisphaerales bacterium]
PPPPPPPTRQLPEPVNISGVLRAIDADERVQFPQARAPQSESLARAMAQFAGALVNGQHREFAGFLAPESRPVLDDLVADGRWDEGVSQVEAVRVVHYNTTGTREVDGALEVTGAQFVLAIQEPGEAYTLGWRASQDRGGAWKFAAMPTSSDVKARASEWDSDSMSAFMDRGGGSRRAVARGAASDIRSMLEQAPPIVQYCAVEVSKRLSRAAGVPEMMVNAAHAMEPAVQARYDAGKAEYDSGARPSGPAAEVVYVSSSAALSAYEQIATNLGAEAALQPVSIDQAAEIIAEVLGVDVAEAKRRLEAASANAPSLEDLLPPGTVLPGGEAPGEEAPGGRPGTTRRNTPGGPIDVPTSTPGPGDGG